MDERMHTFQTIYGDEVSFALPEEEVVSLTTDTNEDIRRELINFTLIPGNALSPGRSHAGMAG